MVQGYAKTHSRPQLQAHAIRIHELAELIAATQCDSDAQLRDVALLTTVFDPESSLAFLTDQFDDGAFDLERVLIEGEQRDAPPQR